MQSSLGLDLVNGYQVTCFTKLQGNHVPRLAQCVDPDLPSATQTPRTEAQEIMQRAAQAFNAYKILQNDTKCSIITGACADWGSLAH